MIFLPHQKGKIVTYDLCMSIMPHDTKASNFYGCCGKLVCNSCFTRSSTNMFNSQGGLNSFLEAWQERTNSSCPFCRSSDDVIPNDKKDCERREQCLESRANKGDSRAVLELAYIYRKGLGKTDLDKIGDNDSISLAFGSRERSSESRTKELQYFQKAASMGNSQAYYELAILHRKQYDAVGFFSSLQKATALGNFEAREELAYLAIEMKQVDIAMAHHKILASEGFSKESLEKLTEGYKDGCVTKDELETAIRAYHSSREELCTKERTVLELFNAGISSDGKSVKPLGMFM